MDVHLLIGAALCFFLSLGYTFLAFRAGRYRPGIAHLVAMLGGFVLLSISLYQRGLVERSCPINSLFDVLIFMAWAIVLIYLLVGAPYRLSLMGAFTAPLVLMLLGMALLGPIDRSTAIRVSRNPWVEFHASFSLVAYGAFALAGIAGLMYLIQNHQLKSKRGGALLFSLPPVTELGVANARLLWLGFVLLTIGFAAGFLSGMSVNSLKFGTSVFLWAVYGAILGLRKLRSLSPRRTAALSVAVLALLLATLPVIQHLSTLR